MNEVVLVRHAPTRRDATRPSTEWRLRADAGGPIRDLADRLGPLALDLVVTSLEPKAVATGRGLAEHLRLPLTSEPRLHEHDRGNVPLLPDAAWHDTLRRFFRHPDVLVFGRETASEARERFRGGLVAALERNRAERPAVVAHGTVMSLLVAQANDLDAFELWRSVAMPEAWLLGWPDLELKARIAGDGARAAPESGPTRPER